eukprot:TRINITY_DN13078_c0_g1_i1.p1 TRINITY_DN13078_c0_g1~~TRINITY_DN13078_c0_g1_i1.p1  ORF type:complete len:1184 (+),score=24.77 TRINITY_DN13078_c0_g1_i1:67-3618(+)
MICFSFTVVFVWVALVLHAAADCSCLYQGTDLPSSIYNNYPLTQPGMYQNFSAIAKYGTMCAAWDTVPGTPLQIASCRADANFSFPRFNWCQVPWCYVRESCKNKVATSLFQGFNLYFSYAACGNAPDCLSPGPLGKYGAGVKGCPFDPYNDGKYFVYKSSCPCKYHGKTLPISLYTQFPVDQPGRYKNLPHISIYGTTCAAWDQSPNTPSYSYCPPDSNWCGYEYNWCQAPWCYVESSCLGALSTSVFRGSEATVFSYDTCMSTPDCYSGSISGLFQNLPPRCPFDAEESGWATASTCKQGWQMTECTCLHQGSALPQEIYQNFPASEPGKYANLSAISQYGTICAAWDTIPGTPLQATRCPADANFSLPEFNWCQVPWCYVGQNCNQRHPTKVFDGAKAEGLYFSYSVCGRAPDCFSSGPGGANGRGTDGCPYDPNGDESYRIYKKSCSCKYHGQTLPPSLYTNFPSEQPGKHKDVPLISLYGTTCASWDLIPNFPYFALCPPSSNWCGYEYNWCQAPWCFVDASCPSAVPSVVFAGSSTAFYSFDTCLSTPDCFTHAKEGSLSNLPSACPFDKHDNGWPTTADCRDGWADEDCSCMYEGRDLPESLYTNFPQFSPGLHRSPSIAKYGTLCAAWDMMPGTPFQDLCPLDADFSSPTFNWCQVPWCFVREQCSHKIPTQMFYGSTTAYYSYWVCGQAPDCNTNRSVGVPGCPYDPHGNKSYTIHKSNCACLYHGKTLPRKLYEASKYKDIRNIELYGTTCAAWDHSPNYPYYSSCPKGANWCAYEYNWCQAPWCYVDRSCPSGMASTVFQDPGAAFYSYDTCLGAPDCFTNSAEGSRDKLPSTCPFSSTTSGWNSAARCNGSWSDIDCSCTFQGQDLPASLYENYPVNKPGAYRFFPTIKKYGTMCAPWDTVPGTPENDRCPVSADFSTKWYNWCQLPWCYVSEKCDKKVPTDTFKGSKYLYFSYAVCGDAPDCYSDGLLGSFGEGTPRCPYDPHGDQSYKLFQRECDCVFHGQQLPASIYTKYPNSAPGKYRNIPSIHLYGTTCAAWDQSPDTPWFEYCPADADWCSYGANWCQIPWCYVGAHCRSGLPSTVFAGSDTAFYSYETCGSHDCYTNSAEGKRHLLPAACPFDSKDTNWATAANCSDGWTADSQDVNKASSAALSLLAGIVMVVSALYVYMLDR